MDEVSWLNHIALFSTHLILFVHIFHVKDTGTTNFFIFNAILITWISLYGPRIIYNQSLSHQRTFLRILPYTRMRSSLSLRLVSFLKHSMIRGYTFVIEFYLPTVYNAFDIQHRDNFEHILTTQLFGAGIGI